MRRLRETSEEFQRRKEAAFRRWKANEEEDPRERDPRDDGYHPRFRDPRRDPRLGGESDDDDNDAE
jgi:hypothetical protein